MKKKLNFIISFLLIISMMIGLFAIPAASYENDVKTTSSAMLLVNLDTDTVCYSIEPDRRRYASYMSELMTFIVAAEAINAPEKRKVEVKESFIDSLPYSDGALDLFIGKTLTLKDLLTIMMLNSGSDAAYLIADTMTGGDIAHFVDLMNQKAAQIGCDRTQFVTPGYSESNQHFTTCRDIYKMFKRIYTIPLYKEIMESPTYIPPGYEIEPEEVTTDARTPQTETEVVQDYEITTECSFINPASPYYFRYATGGKFSFSPAAKVNLMVTTRYRSKSYIFVAMHGKNGAEENAFADARRMVVWAYLNLSDRKVIDAKDTITTYHVGAGWGEYDVSLYASNSAFKTLPIKYQKDKFAYEISIPNETDLPVFEGQNIGTAKIYYDGEKIDDVNLVSASGEGISLLGDISRFGIYAFSEILSNEPSEDAVREDPIVIIVAPPTEAPTEAPTAAPTQPPTQAPTEEESEDDEYEDEWYDDSEE